MKRREGSAIDATGPRRIVEVLFQGRPHLSHADGRQQYSEPKSHGADNTMPGDNMLSAGAATVIWGVWTAIELGFRRHRTIPSRDWDNGSYTPEGDARSDDTESRDARAGGPGGPAIRRLRGGIRRVPRASGPGSRGGRGLRRYSRRAAGHRVAVAPGPHHARQGAHRRSPSWQPADPRDPSSRRTDRQPPCSRDRIGARRGANVTVRGVRCVRWNGLRVRVLVDCAARA